MTSLNVVRLLAEENQGRAPRARLVVIEKTVSKIVYRNSTLLRSSAGRWGGLALVGKTESRLAVAGAVPHLPGRRVLAQAGSTHKSKRVRATSRRSLLENGAGNSKQGGCSCHAAAARSDNPVDGVQRDVAAGFVHEAVRGVLAVAEPLRQRRAGVGSKAKFDVGFDENVARNAVWQPDLVAIDHDSNVDSERVLAPITKHCIC